MREPHSPPKESPESLLSRPRAVQAPAPALKREGGLAAWLEARLEYQVEVRWGRSRTAPIRSRMEVHMGRGGRRLLRLHLHHMFRRADERTLDALLVWSRGQRKDPAVRSALQDFMRRELAREPKNRRPSKVAPCGAVHDLEALAAPLFKGPFRGEFTSPGSAPSPERDALMEGSQALPPRPALTWGRRGRSRTRHTLRLGCFMPGDNLVRIHAALDQEGVPDWFVRFVLFHEILHAAIPTRRGPGGRRILHGPDFRQRERAYADYERAIRWEEANLPRLLTSARTGRPLRSIR